MMVYNKDSEVRIEMLPANEGDCFLITLVEEDIHILIDGGTKETYQNCLKERLIQLNKDSKEIDLLVVTHIDNDHIGGIIELLRDNGSSSEPEIIKINNIWHNSYRHLQFEMSKKIGRKEEQILRKMISNGVSNVQSQEIVERKGISALQGTTLAALIMYGGYCWNQQFEGAAILYNDEEIKLGKECFITVLLPKKQELERLGKRWRNELLKSKFSFEFSDDELFDDAFEYYWRCLVANRKGENKEICITQREIDKGTLEQLATKQGKADDSETNRSSISLLIKYKEKKMLFLADNLTNEVLKVLSDDNKELSLIKIPHHGSINNISDDFIENIDTDTYLISTSSEKFGHPNVETLAKLACKRTKYKKKIYFNYQIKEVTKFENNLNEMDDIEFIYLEKGQEVLL